MRPILMLLSAAVLVLGACSTETDSATSSLETVQVGGAAQQITSLTESAVQNALAEQGESAGSPVVADSLLPGWNQLGMAGVPVSGGTQSFSFGATDIDFTGAVDISTSVNLNPSDYPNATGTLNIAASVTGPTGNIASGSVSYNAITVTTADDVTVTDPVSGATASWPNGTVFTYSAAISWTRTDANNWTYTSVASSTANNRTVTITGKGKTYTGQVDHDFDWTREVSRTGGGSIVSTITAFSGTRDVTWTDVDTAVSHEVNWVINSLSDIAVTVDGFTFNFSSVAALIALLNVNLDHDD